MLDSWLYTSKMNKRVSISALPLLPDFCMDSWENLSVLVVEATIQVFNYTSTPVTFQVRHSHPAHETPQAPVRTIWSLLSEERRQQRLTLLLACHIFKRF